MVFRRAYSGDYSLIDSSVRMDPRVHGCVKKQGSNNLEKPGYEDLWFFWERCIKKSLEKGRNGTWGEFEVIGSDIKTVRFKIRDILSSVEVGPKVCPTSRLSFYLIFRSMVSFLTRNKEESKILVPTEVVHEPLYFDDKIRFKRFSLRITLPSLDIHK